MPVLFFDQTKFCIVCGHSKDRCVCDKTNLRACDCNPWGCAGGCQTCPKCDGRGWVEKTKGGDPS